MPYIRSFPNGENISTKKFKRNNEVVQFTYHYLAGECSVGMSSIPIFLRLEEHTLSCLGVHHAHNDKGDGCNQLCCTPYYHKFGSVLLHENHSHNPVHVIDINWENNFVELKYIFPVEPIPNIGIFVCSS